MRNESHHNPQSVTLRGAQKNKLRGLAMSLKPALVLGKQGLSEAVIREFEIRFDREELIKVKLLGDRIDRKETAALIEEKTGAILAGLVGSSAAFYRQNPDPKKRIFKNPR